MGAPQEIDLPASSSPTLILTHPTPAERIRIWALTHKSWGKVLSLEEYLHREEYLLTVPVAKGGGVTQWILTVRSLPPDQRPILSSCDTIRKTALVSSSSGQPVKDVVAHGIGAVYTDPIYRGRGYASKLMVMVGEALKTHQGSPMSIGRQMGKQHGLATTQTASRPAGLAPVAFSVLFSDIGKTFYANRGWAAHPSTHLAFPPLEPDSESITDGTASPSPAAPIRYHELAELCACDEALLRKRMARMLPPASSTTPGTPHSFVALAPDLDAILWHMMREDFITHRIFDRAPTVRGGVHGPKGRRVWAVWTRAYQTVPPTLPPSSIVEPAAGNTLHILRLVVEDEACSDEDLAQSVAAILRLARKEAFEWGAGHVELWNPAPRLEGAIASAGLPYEVVEREMDSIPSLMWYGDGAMDGVVWVANEKYAWY